jgi:hypothetical protein
MHLTERYIQLCRELAAAGYQWQPRPGDWMLDLNDESVGMLTTYIQRPELVVRNNVQLPYGNQIGDLLTARGITTSADGPDQIWRSREGQELHRCPSDQLADHGDEEALVALITDYTRRK